MVIRRESSLLQNNFRLQCQTCLHVLHTVYLVFQNYYINEQRVELMNHNYVVYICTIINFNQIYKLFDSCINYEYFYSYLLSKFILLLNLFYILLYFKENHLNRNVPLPPPHSQHYFVQRVFSSPDNQHLFLLVYFFIFCYQSLVVNNQDHETKYLSITKNLQVKFKQVSQKSFQLLFFFFFMNSFVVYQSGGKEIVSAKLSNHQFFLFLEEQKRQILIIKLFYFSTILIVNSIIFTAIYELILNKDLLKIQLELLGNWEEIQAA